MIVIRNKKESLHFLIFFFNFRRREWLVIIGREDLLYKEELNVKSYLVCASHFEESQMNIKTLKLLREDALPSRQLPNQSQESASMCDVVIKSEPGSPERVIELPALVSKATQTSKGSVAEFKDCPAKRKLRKDLQVSETKRRRLEQKIERIEKEAEAKSALATPDPDDDISRRFQKLIEWQNKIKSKFKGNRFDSEYKTFALNLHYSSPHAYRCLQSALKLPSESTIRRLKLQIPPKLDEQVMHGLSLKLKSLPAEAKYCTLCVDEMVLKRNLFYEPKTDDMIGLQSVNGTVSAELASISFAIELQGMYVDWQQPVAYSFLASAEQYVELDAWLDDVIRKLIGVGVEVKAVVSGQGSNYDKYCKAIKNVSVSTPYFFVDERKIYYILDVPHLMKCLRNDLLSSNFHLDRNVISWYYIEQLYENQKEKKVMIIPKITKSHVEPNNNDRKKVQYAVQIFSKSVYAALETYIDFGKITDNARETANFIITMDKLFDVLNSSEVKSAKTQTPFKMSDEQKNILKEGLDMFACMQSTNRNTGRENACQSDTFLSFQITIHSVLRLFEDMKTEGFQNIFTRRLTRQSLDQLFDAIRHQQPGGHSPEPLPIQFMRAFSEMYLVNMMKSSAEGEREPDIYEILLKTDEIISNKMITPIVEPKPSLVSLGSESEPQMDFPEAHTLKYVTSYLLFKCSDKHSCKEMTAALKLLPNLNQTDLFAHFEAYNKKAPYYKKLKLPSQVLYEYVEKLDEVFTDHFAKSIEDRPGSKIFSLLKVIPLPKSSCQCSCFPFDYLIKVFVRLRIFMTLKLNNRNFKAGKKTIKQSLIVKPLCSAFQNAI